MTQLGADPEDLTVLARSLRDAAGRLDSLSSGLTRRVRHTPWTGADAAALQRRWHAVQRPGLLRCATDLRALAQRVEAHRDEQDHASSAGGSTAVAALGGVAAGAATPPSSLRLAPIGPGQLAPLPLVEDRFVGTVEARVGPLAGSISAEVTLARLDRDLVRVTVAQRVGAGGTLGVGAGVDVALGGPHGAHGSTQGIAAEAAGRLGVVQRRSWTVPADGVQDLLAKLAVEQVAVAATGQARPQVVAAGVLDELVERLTGVDPGADLAAALTTAVPEPDSTDSLAEVELAAAGAAGLGAVLGLGGRAQVTQTARVGTVERDGRHHAVLELDGAGTAAVASTLLRRAGLSLPADAHRGATVRLEAVAASSHGPARLELRTRLTEDTHVRDSVVRLHPRGHLDAAALHRVTQHLARHDVPAALVALDQVQLDVGTVEVRTGDGTLSGHSARGSGGAALGVGGGVSLRGQVVRVDRR